MISCINYVDTDYRHLHVAMESAHAPYTSERYEYVITIWHFPGVRCIVCLVVGRFVGSFSEQFSSEVP